jgi:hypothetical protein
MNTSKFVVNDRDMWLSNQSDAALSDVSFANIAHSSLSSQFDNTTTWSIDRMAWAGGVLVWSGDAQYHLDAADPGPVEQGIWPVSLLWLQPASLCSAKPASTGWGN